jgi:hypothetical protein
MELNSDLMGAVDLNKVKSDFGIRNMLGSA